MYHHLKVKRSTLPGSGKGLFTRRDIRKGERVVEYLGETISDRECNRRAQEDKIGYVLWINRNTCIDAYHHPEALARYANDAKGLVRVNGIRNNAEYDIEDGRGYIVASRHIKAGSEILVSYGAEYWSDIRYNMRLERKQRREAARNSRLKWWLNNAQELAADSWQFCSVFVAGLIRG